MRNVILLILILTLSCKDKKNNSNKKSSEKAEIKTTKSIQETKYITAKSGLIYRDKPKGKQLGKFEFNDQIMISEHSKVFQEIMNGNKTVKGEWVGTEIKGKTVYVFSGFLSDNINKVKYILDDILKLKSHQQIEKKFGKENVVYSKIAGEDNEGEGGSWVDENTLIFPNTKNEVKVSYQDGEVYMLSLHKEKSDVWYTKEGVYMGMSFKEIKELNNRIFDINYKYTENDGFPNGGYDISINWNKGNLSKMKSSIYFTCDFTPKLPKENEQLFITKTYKSNEQRFKTAKVSSIYISK
ncbi:hypothetical protein [Tenacibaculum finnmarkense]|uniref:hypothetical protein n=1 Tax=Tenacibaculum finnmarkense TaxID=2781243 RepID=UPI003BB76FB9